MRESGGWTVLHKQRIRLSHYLWGAAIMYTNGFCYSACREINSTSNFGWHFNGTQAWGLHFHVTGCGHIRLSVAQRSCVLCVLICLQDCFYCFSFYFFFIFWLFSRRFLLAVANVLLSVRPSATWLDLVSAPKLITLASGWETEQ